MAAARPHVPYLVYLYFVHLLQEALKALLFCCGILFAYAGNWQLAVHSAALCYFVTLKHYFL